MTRDLSRLLNPKSILVVGGGVWSLSVIAQCRKMGFSGDLFALHPTKAEIAGIRAYSTVTSLPYPPDAVFLGVNRDAAILLAAQLAEFGAGGAICFASGFAEAAAEDTTATDYQARLLEAAGDMPILGPNCYGFINALDSAPIWPDQHGCVPVESGVAILTQSSNIAINLTMQTRALPVAYMIAAGNQAQTAQADIALAILDDPRVTALGIHVEGFGDLRGWEALAEKAHRIGKPVVVLKVGRSEQARAATQSHTASLAGGYVAAAALLKRLGMAQAPDLPCFLETLKLLHMTGPLPSNRIASISCSGGEASLAADMAVGCDLVFPSLNEIQTGALRAALGPKVALANPLDYHTYIWRDTAAMTRAWAAMMDPSLALTLLIVDFPRIDRCEMSDWDSAIDAAIAARQRTGANVAMVATLPELMPEPVADRLAAGGVVPLSGLHEALHAAEAAALLSAPATTPLFLPNVPGATILIDEADAKARLAVFGLDIPKSLNVTFPEDTADAALEIGGPVVLKGVGFAHKTEADAVRLNLTTSDAVVAAAQDMPADSFLVEEMIEGGIAELLVGITRDGAHGLLLTLAAGGTLAEILEDSRSLLLPAHAGDIRQALLQLKIAPLLLGFRGKPAVDLNAAVDAILAIQAYVLANGERVEEVEVNPLILTASRAVAADALLREA